MRRCENKHVATICSLGTAIPDVSSGALHYLLNVTSGRDMVWRNDCEQRNDVYIYGSMMIVLRVEDSKPNRRRKHGCVKCW